MNKTFRYRYKRYVFDSIDFLEYEITAKNKREAYIKIFSEHNGISFDEAKTFIKEHFEGEDWSVKDAMKWLNPLGSPDTALYRIDEIKQI